METKMAAVDPGALREEFEIPKDRFHKIVTYAFLAVLIEQARPFNILNRVFESEDPHELQPCSRDLSSSRERNFASPRSALSFRSFSTMPCHSGEGISGTSRQRASHNCSIA